MRIAHLALLSTLAATVIALLALPAPAGAACTPGDLMITGIDTRANVTIDTCGSVSISASAFVSWTDVTLLFNSSAADGHGLFVDGIVGFLHVNISAPAGAAAWVFTINSSAVVTIEGSDLSGMAGSASDPGATGTAAGTEFSTLVGGVRIYSTRAQIGNSTLHDNWGTNLYVGGDASPRINDNVISDALYLAFQYATSYSSPTQTSSYRAIAACAVLASGQTDFDTNRVERCGRDGSANVSDFGSQGATNALSEIQLVGAGVVVLGGHPVLRQDQVDGVVPIAAANQSFTSMSGTVTLHFTRLAGWGLLFKNAAGGDLSGGFIRDAATGVEMMANASYSAGVDVVYDFFLLTVNGTYTNGIAGDFAGLSDGVTLTFAQSAFRQGGASVASIKFDGLSAAHSATFLGGSIDLNGVGTGIALEDRSSSGRATFTVGLMSIVRTRAPISLYFNGLTGGADASVHNNTINQTAGNLDLGARLTTRGGIDVRGYGFPGNTFTVLIEDNRVINQSWQLGAARYPGITYEHSASSGMSNSLTVRRNQISNVSYGMYLYENYGSAAQSSSYTVTDNRIALSTTDGGLLQSVAVGGNIDPAFDRNFFDRANGYGFQWILSSGLVAPRVFGNNTVLGLGLGNPSSRGLAFLFGNAARWSLTVVDTRVSNAFTGLRFQFAFASVQRSNLTSTSTGVVCQDCFARVEDTAIYPLSAAVSGPVAEVVAYQPFGATRVQWQAEGGTLITSTSLYLKWYGPFNPITLATIPLSATGNFTSRSVAAWRSTQTIQDRYGNVTPVLRINNVDVLGIPVPFQSPYFGSLIILDPELPFLTYATPGPNTQLRDTSVTVKGSVADATTGVEVVQISTDGVNFENVSTYDPITGAWEQVLNFAVDGVYTITIHAWDRARWSVTFGNYSAGYKEVVISGVVIDTQAPVIQLDSPITDITTHEKVVQLVGQVRDANPLAQFKISFNGVDLIGQPDVSGNFLTTLPNLTEGPNLVSILAVDLAGNTNILTRTVTLDTKAPFILLRSPTNNSFTNRAGIQIIGEVEAGVTVRVNGLAVSLPSGYTLSQGENRIWVNATDAGGNMASVLLIVTLDRAPPSVTFTDPSRFPFSTNSPRVVVAGRASEPLSLVVINNVSYPLESPTTFSVELYLEDGSHAVTVRLVDLANNSLDVTPLPVVIVDTQPPALVIESPDLISIQPTRNIVVRGHTDLNSFINATTPSGTFPLNVNPLTGEFSFEDTRTTDGTFNYRFEASDGVGNKVSIPLQITVDTTSPSVEVIDVANNQRTSDDYIRLRGTVSPGTKLTANGARVALDCPAQEDQPCSFEFLYPLEADTNTISMVATDLAGNQGVRSIFVQRDTVTVAGNSEFGPIFVIIGAALGAVMIPFWIRKFRNDAAAAHPGLGIAEAVLSQPADTAANVVYEPDAQDMYAGDYRPQPPPKGGA
jgi:hypothetical protein